MNHLIGDIAQPDPIPAPHHATPPSVASSRGDFGALFGAAAFLPALARRRPCKFFGGERHLSVLASTPCAHPQMSTGVVRRDGNTFHETGN